MQPHYGRDFGIGKSLVIYPSTEVPKQDGLHCDRLGQTQEHRPPKVSINSEFQNKPSEHNAENDRNFKPMQPFQSNWSLLNKSRNDPITKKPRSVI